MKEWSLPIILESLHKDIQNRLEIIRESLKHPGTKGDASETVWLSLLEEYLPHRYKVATAHIVDSKGVFSEQIDVVVFDRQYSPFIFKYEGQKIIPAESVYAVFEAKQTIDVNLVSYAQKKVESVRKLHRTSLPIPHAGGEYPPKPLIHIYGGILTLESEWSPALGKPLKKALNGGVPDGRLDFGCVAAHGYFHLDQKFNDYEFYLKDKSATSFLFKLISQLQFSATVPMIDIQAYAQWISK